MSPSRILIIKTSSMGDLVHALPVLTDIARHFPGVPVDWVAEEGFAAIPGLSRHVAQVIPVALRRWRKQWMTAPVRAERALFVARLRSHRYSAVVDLQGLTKSAAIGLYARGPVHGYALGSGRDPLAALFYRRRHRVSLAQSAVARNRKLAARALGYTVDGPPRFDLDADALARALPLPMPPRYAAIMPSASRPTKLWPEDRWQAVLHRLARERIATRVFAGNDVERARAERLVADVPDAEVLPAMDLRRAAQVLAGARLVVGLDSGLTHLAGALGRPTVGIYCDYDPALAPVVGDGYIATLGGPGTPPALDAVIEAVERGLAWQPAAATGDATA